MVHFLLISSASFCPVSRSVMLHGIMVFVVLLTLMLSSPSLEGKSCLG